MFDPQTLSIEDRRGRFTEVESSLSSKDACQESTRCLRCDLEFTRTTENGEAAPVEEKASA